jgi:hypothetical protein
MGASTQDEIAALDRICSRVALTKEDALEVVRPPDMHRTCMIYSA